MRKTPIPLGCAFFDDPGAPRNGWFTRPGEKPKRFATPERLLKRGTGIWLTNISYVQRAQANLPKKLAWRTADYLHEDITRLAERYGIRDAREIALFGATIFTRTLLLARTVLHNPIFTPRYTLKLGFKKHMGLTQSQVTREQAHALTEATFYTINCPLGHERYPARSDIGSFLVPARRHCLALFDTPLPSGFLIEAKNLPDPAADRTTITRFLSDHKDRPGLFHVVRHAVDPEKAPLLWFAKGFAAPKRDLWLTTPDMELISPWTDLSIEKAYFATARHRCDLARHIALSLPEYTLCSLSAALVLENLWHGLCAGTPKQQGTDFDLFSANLLAPFLRASDRLLLLPLAANLVARGLRVLGYGNGRIRVDLSHADRLACYHAACDNHIIPPFLGLAPETIPAPDPTNPLAVVQFLFATSNRTALLEADAQIVAKEVASCS